MPTLAPKSQVREDMVLVQLSVNVTDNGAGPNVGAALNAAIGAIAPLPRTVLVELPPLSLAKRTLLVNPPSVTGANCTTTLVDPPGAMSNAAPDRSVYGPPVTVATPFDMVVPPLLVTTNVLWAIVPVANTPKSINVGETLIWPGVRPVPSSSFVETPPLLLKITLPMKTPPATGMKLTVTVPVRPGPTLYGVPLVITNG